MGNVSDPTRREIIEVLGTKVMGWRKTELGNWSCGGVIVCSTSAWDPLTDPAAGKQVRDRMVELGWRFHLEVGKLCSTATYYRDLELGRAIIVTDKETLMTEAQAALGAVEGK